MQAPPHCLSDYMRIWLGVRILLVTPNGPELTGADPHAEKYSAGEAATSGAASGAAWS
jgi:hypothetical protein